MTTEQPCRKCQSPLKVNNKTGIKSCRNGCEQYTAQPVGTEYLNRYRTTEGTDGRTWQECGQGIRRMPTNREE